MTINLEYNGCILGLPIFGEAVTRGLIETLSWLCMEGILSLHGCLIDMVRKIRKKKICGLLFYILRYT